MNIKPTYHFDNGLSTGIDKVPLDTKIIVKDWKNGTSIEVTKTDNGTLTSTSTINDFLADPLLYIRIGIQNNTIGTSKIVNQIWSGTQLEYDALGTYELDVLYFIRE